MPSWEALYGHVLEHFFLRFNAVCTPLISEQTDVQSPVRFNNGCPVCTIEFRCTFQQSVNNCLRVFRVTKLLLYVSERSLKVNCLNRFIPRILHIVAHNYGSSLKRKMPGYFIITEQSFRTAQHIMLSQFMYHFSSDMHPCARYP